MPQTRERSRVEALLGVIELYDSVTETLTIRTREDRVVLGRLGVNCQLSWLGNIGDQPIQITDKDATLVEGQTVFCRGVIDGRETSPSTLWISTLQCCALNCDWQNESYPFEHSAWWIAQQKVLIEQLVGSRFPTQPSTKDPKVQWRAIVSSEQRDHGRLVSTQQDATELSQLICAFVSSFQLTGDDRYLALAQSGTDYLRMTFRSDQLGADYAFWHQAIEENIATHKRRAISTIHQQQEYDAISVTVQYAVLEALAQVYWVTRKEELLLDIERTVALILGYFKDNTGDGFFAYIDTVLLSPQGEPLKNLAGIKNIGSNCTSAFAALWRACGADHHLKLLDQSADILASHFSSPGRPFMSERFCEDEVENLFPADIEQAAQKDHTEAFNLARLNDEYVVSTEVALRSALALAEAAQARPDPRYLALATKIAHKLPKISCDRGRGGWYSHICYQPIMDQEGAVALVPANFGAKKSSTQQQAIITYLVLSALFKDKGLLLHVRDSAIFYHAANICLETETIHSAVAEAGQSLSESAIDRRGLDLRFRLPYVAALYCAVSLEKSLIELHFRPKGPGILKVAPVTFAPGSAWLTSVTVDGKSWTDYDATHMTVNLPNDGKSHRVIAVLAAAAPGVKPGDVVCKTAGAKVG